MEMLHFLKIEIFQQFPGLTTVKINLNTNCKNLLEGLRLSPLVLALPGLIVTERPFGCWLCVIVHSVGILDPRPDSLCVCNMVNINTFWPKNPLVWIFFSSESFDRSKHSNPPAALLQAMHTSKQWKTYLVHFPASSHSLPSCRW